MMELLNLSSGGGPSVLKLAGQNLTVQHCETICSALKSENSSLIELDLSNNDLQDSGVELLSAGLKSSNCKLEILRLSGCMITEEGCSFLAAALSSNPFHLKELDLSYNDPGESGVKLLSAKLEDPQCKLSTLRVEHGGKIRLRPGLKKYACNLTLDPNTAFPRFTLSEGNKMAENGEEWLPYPDHPERFEVYGQVMSKESLTGRCYWEVLWSSEIEVGVVYKSIKRKGGSYDTRLGLNDKSWTLFCSERCYSVRHNDNTTELPPPPSGCRRVGVYVDCPAGTLSFYSISSNTLAHIYTFNTTFTETLNAGILLYDLASACL